MDEGVIAKPVKKFKKRPTPHYLMSTTATKAMHRKKEPLSKTAEIGNSGRSGVQQVPMSMTKMSSAPDMAAKTMN